MAALTEPAFRESPARAAPSSDGESESSGTSGSGGEEEGAAKRISSVIVQASESSLPSHDQPAARYSSDSPRPKPRGSPHYHRRHHRSPSPAPRRGRRGRRHASSSSEPEKEDTPPPKRKKEEPDPLTMRTGGAYIPPARLRLMQEGITDKSSVAYQRISWEALKKSINGLINKVNVSNIGNIVQELFQENVVRGRGLLSRSIIQAQAASPMFTHVYACLVSVINTKFPQTGELIAKRLIMQFRKGFRRNDKGMCITAVKFLAHLVNQQVLHELVSLEVLTLLLEEPTDDSVEVAVGFLKECGLKLTEVTPRGVHGVFETLRSILHSGKITSRVQYMIEVMFAIRKDKFKEHPIIPDGLDLVDENDQITHLLSLDDDFDTEDGLNVFYPDPDFVANEEKYAAIKAEILGEGGSGSSDSGSGGSSDDEDEEGSDDDGNEAEGVAKIDINDMTDSKLLALRRTIYLTIMSSLDFEECAHKLLKNMQEGTESVVAQMLIECCNQERSYLRFYGLLGQRLCLLNQAWVEVFDTAFQDQYATVHRLETNKLRNVAKFFGQLFYADALPWTCMSCIHLNEEETNSSSRIFVKILFQELSEFMGLAKLNERLRDPVLSIAFEGLLPRDNPKNTRFAINFFTSIGLGGLTDDLREHLKNTQKLIMEQKQDVSSSDSEESKDSDSDSSSDSSSSSSGSENSSSSASDSSSSDEKHRRRHRRARAKKEEEEEEEERKRSRDKKRREQSKRSRNGSREKDKKVERDDSRKMKRREERSGSKTDGRRRKEEGGGDRSERNGKEKESHRSERRREEREDSGKGGRRRERSHSADEHKRRRERGDRAERKDHHAEPDRDKQERKRRRDDRR